MRKTNLILVLLIVLAAFVCTTGVASAFEAIYVGNTVVDLQWPKYEGEDFSGYKLYRNETLIAALGRNAIFYRDTGPAKGMPYAYTLSVLNRTGVRILNGTIYVTTGEVHGTITLDTTWTAATSPYNIYPHQINLVYGVIVEENVTLTIGKGVTVNNGNGIRFYGTLSPLDTVTFNGRGITLSDVNGYSIKNCVFDGTGTHSPGGAGIYLIQCSNSIISNNVFKNHPYGICMDSSSSNTFTSNTVSNNLRGIYLRQSSNSRLKDNTVSNGSGIYLGPSSNDNTLAGNTVSNGGGISMGSSSNDNTFSDNTVSNGGGISMGSSSNDNTFSGNTASNNGGSGISMGSSSNDNTFSGNTALNNSNYGIYLDSSSNDNTFSGNTVSNNYRGIFLRQSNNSMLTDNTASNNRGDGIRLGSSSNNRLTGNTALNNGNGIYLVSSSNNNRLTGNTASNNDGRGISLHFSSNNELTNNIANSNSDYGIYLDYSSNNELTNNIANSNNGDGIYLGSTSNNRLTGNTVSNNGDDGIYLRNSGNNTFINNNVSNNLDDGISLYRSDNNLCENNRISRNERYGIYLSYSINNSITENLISRDTDNKNSWDMYLGSSSENNQFDENTFGSKHPTKISIYDYHGIFMIRGVEDPPEPPKPPEYPTTRQSISKYVQIWNLSADTTLFLDFHYDDKDVKDVNEETLKVWKHFWKQYGTAWDEGKGDDPWNGTRKLDTANNIVGVEVKKFCIFAPLAGAPVHNIDTVEDFDTIQDAIDDPDTIDGHTITVDPDYTELETKENVVVDKELTIESSSGNPSDTVIEAANVNEHTIQVESENVKIQGFTIKGGTGQGKVGIYIASTVHSCSISQNLVTGNNIGILFNSDHEATLSLESTIIRDNLGDGINAALGFDEKIGDLVIKGTGNEIVHNGGYGIITLNGDVIIEGTTEIHDNGAWGIWTGLGKVEIRDGAMSSINRNGEGGIMGMNGVSLPPNFVVDDNGGPGIYCGGDDPLLLENVKVRNNIGHGIYTGGGEIVGKGGDVYIHGTDNEITNNGGNGIYAQFGGDVTIKGTGTEIHDNGGWGIWTGLGKVDIRDGAMSSINKKGEGGIRAMDGVSLPPNFVVEDNGGPGIYGGGEDALFLENVKVRSNIGHGIETGGGDIVGKGGDVVIQGTDNEITNNGGNGIYAQFGGDVLIQGTGTEIHDNGGWGIWTGLGKVDIHNGAMSSVNKNGKGGIRGMDGVSLPPNFVVEDNGGSGIVCGGEDTLFLENAKVRNNGGNGIGVLGGRCRHPRH